MSIIHETDWRRAFRLRASNENVVTHGLFCLERLMNHRNDFQWLVMEKLGKAAADGVN